MDGALTISQYVGIHCAEASGREWQSNLDLSLQLNQTLEKILYSAQMQ
jgi:hypothetical protein